jgi:transcriptional accessory protein Tex/SPT6
MADPATQTQSEAKESFAALLDESLGTSDGLEGTVLKGTIVALEGDTAVVDVGLKSEGRVAVKEFSEAGQPPEIKVGDEVEVYLERMENKNGEAVLSREKAKREEAWTQLEKSFNDNARVTGIIFACRAARWTFARCATSARSWEPRSRSRSSRWTARAATSWSRAAPSWRRPAPSSVPS